MFLPLYAWHATRRGGQLLETRFPQTNIVFIATAARSRLCSSSWTASYVRAKESRTHAAKFFLVASNCSFGYTVLPRAEAATLPAVAVVAARHHMVARVDVYRDG